MSATVRDARYRICDGGNPGWHVVRRYNEHGTRMVELHNPDLAHLALDGRAVTNCAESKLIPVEAATHGTTDAPTAGAANYAAVGASSSRPGGSPITPGAGTAAATVSPAVAAAPIDEPSARATDPQPAHDAAKTAKALASERRIICLLAHETAGGEGLTGHELEAATGIEYDVIGPRRPWLERNGFLEPNGLRRANPKGNTEGVYVITEAGRDMCRRLRLEGKAAA